MIPTSRGVALVPLQNKKKSNILHVHQQLICQTESNNSNNESNNDQAKNKSHQIKKKLDQQTLEQILSKIPQDGKERMMIAFDCGNCGTQSARICQKKVYYEGLVLMQCRGCNQWHLMSDHLHWFVEDDKFRVDEQFKNKSLEEIKEMVLTTIQQKKGASSKTEASTQSHEIYELC
ncbi:hypothetical protein RFI_22345 [Reticulomyxa filosa]|uniref:DNL-type domain-containing protein n=1 Tax=Reticulomyxa filosa TaxID=46433 RepID=X6MMF1_RETFI|nr:hypothetical protein RFI_22345 [Reticulomyxa filosa]|eukprot:ETO15024.1 hypothetical protein RFI_22345 [Reticulomyxa filosa]